MSSTIYTDGIYICPSWAYTKDSNNNYTIVNESACNAQSKNYLSLSNPFYTWRRGKNIPEFGEQKGNVNSDVFFFDTRKMCTNYSSCSFTKTDKCESLITNFSVDAKFYIDKSSGKCQLKNYSN